MSTSIEQRVVQMKFDNKQFEAGVAQSMSTLDKFESKLNFKGAAKGFDDISKAANSVSLNGLVTQTDNVGAKFDALAVVAISALNRITNEAITAGSKLLKSLSIDQVASGWSKYEARTAAVQTLVNATGKSVEQIERYMDKLMRYSDETSYGFDDMTSSLATMVSAGGDINKLVPLLEGFGNAVSFVGKGAAEYKRAVIQLSQAYGAGAMQLQDWKSIEQTLGGAKQLKQVFIEVAEQLGKIQKGEVTLGSFNETLKDKWLTKEVMEQALGQFAEMTERAFAMIEAGEAKNVAEAYEILSESIDDYRIKAAKAAQEAKSFTEAIDATKDAVSTKWMESFQIIFGNYAEATELWTELTDTLYDLFAASGDVRNEILGLWSDMGGRDEMILAVKAAFEALSRPLGAVKDAINEIFFPQSMNTKASILYNAMVELKEFFHAITLSDEAVTNLKKGFKLLLIPVYAFYQALRVGVVIITQTIMLLFALGDAILSLPSLIRSAESPLKRVFGEERYNKLVASFTTIVERLGKAFSQIGSKIATAGKNLKDAVSPKISSSLKKLFDFLAPIGDRILDRIIAGFEYLAKIDFNPIVNWISFGINSMIDGFVIVIGLCYKGIVAVIEFFKSFKDKSPIEILRFIIAAVGTMKDNLVEFVKSLGFDTVLDSLSQSGGGVLSIVKSLGEAIADFILKLTPGRIIVIAFGVSLVSVFIALAKAISSFASVGYASTKLISTITSALRSFQRGVKTSPIILLALSIDILAVSLSALAQIDSNQLIAAAQALAIVMGTLAGVILVATLLSRFVLTSELMAANLIKIALSMLTMAGAAVALSSALYILMRVDLTGVIQKLGVFAGMLAMLVVAVVAVTKFMTGSSLADSLYILAFAASLNLMIGALSKISSMDLSNSTNNLIAMAVIVGLMIAIGAAAKGVRPTSGISMLLFAGVLLLFVKAVNPLANIDMGKVASALFNILTIATIMSLVSLELGISKKLGGSGTSLISMSAGLLILYQAIKSIGSLDTAIIYKGVSTLTAIMAVIAIMNVLSKIGGKGASLVKLQGSFLALSAAVLVLGVAINYIGGLDLAKVAIGTAVVSALMIFLSVLAKALSGTQKATATIVAMTVCIGLITTAVGLFTLLDGQELFNATISLGIAFTGLAALFKFIGAGLGIKKAISTILLLGSALGGIYAAFYYLNNSLDDANRLIPIAEAIGLVLVALGASFALIGKNGTIGIASRGQIARSIALMGGMLLEIGVLIIALDKLKVDSNGLIEKAAAIGIILLALGESMNLFAAKTLMVGNVWSVIETIGGMSIVAGLITALLSILPNSEDIIVKALAFSTVLLTMTGAVLLMKNLIGVASSIPQNAISTLTDISLIVGAMSGVAALLVYFLSLFKVDDTISEKVQLMIVTLGAMIVATGLLSALSKGLTALGNNIAGVANGAVAVGVVLGILELFVLGMALIFVGFGYLLDALPDLDKKLNTLNTVFSSIGKTIGDFFGNLVGAFTGDVEEYIGIALENFAIHLSNFAENIKGFLALDISEDFALTLDYLALAIIGVVQASTELTKNDKFIKGDTLGEFADRMIDFAPKFVEFSNILSGLDIDKTLAAATCLQSLSDLLVNIPTEGGLWGDIFGERDLSGFGEGLSKLAEGVNNYATTLKDSDIDDKTIEKTNKVTETLIELANKLPKTGGLQTIFGESDFKKFGEQIVAYGGSLRQYIDMTKEIKAAYDEKAFENAKTATESMIKLAEKVPESGMLISFFGGQSIGEFGTQLKQYGQGLAAFFSAIAPGKDDKGNDVPVIDKQLADAAKTAGDTMVSLAETLPDTGGLFTFLTGHKSNLGEFGDQLAQFGSGMASFFTAVDQAGLDKGVIDLASSAAEGFVGIANQIDPEKVEKGWFGIGGSAFTNFSDSLKTLGTGIKDFYDKSKGVSWSDVTTAVNQISRVVDFGADIQNLNTTTASNFNDFLSKLADNGIKTFTVAFSTSTDKMADTVSSTILNAMSKARTKVTNNNVSMIPIVDAIMTGVSGHGKDIDSQVVSIVEAITTATNDRSSQLSNAGSLMAMALIIGFESGINNVKARVIKVVTTIVTTTNNTLKIKSGSSEAFKTIGKYCVTGFIDGFSDAESELYTTVKKLGDNTIKSLRSSLDVNSPSKKFAEVGMYSVLGFKSGIDDNIRLAKDSIVKMGEVVLDSIKDFYGIHSPSTVMRDEVGRYIVKGIAEGITSEMSAEEAAAQKAQNIISAFQKEFNKWSLSTTTAQLQYDLWSAMNVNAGEEEAKQHEIELLEKKLAYQAERVNAANAQYEAVLKTGSETDIQEALNTYLQEQISMWNLANELIEKRKAVGDTLDLERAQLEYEQWKLLNKDAKEDEVKQKELDLLDKKLQVQAKVVSDANKTYADLLATLGDSAKETRAAYNEYLTESNNMLQLATEYAEKFNPAELTTAEKKELKDAADKFIEDTYFMYEYGILSLEEWAQYIRENNKEFYGLTEERVEVSEIMDKYVSAVKDDIDEIVDANEIINEYLKNASGSINGVVGNIEVKLVNSSSPTISTDAASNPYDDLDLDMDEITKKIQEPFDDLNLTGGIIDNIRNSIGDVGNSLISMVTGGFDKVKSFFGFGKGSSSSENNPATEVGESIVDSLTEAIDNNADKANESALAVTEAVMDGVSDIPSRYHDIGYQGDEGMALGILKGRFLPVNAAKTVAEDTLNATKEVLDVNSPSREYYWIGEMLSYGLANGISDSASIVKSAVETVLDTAQDTIDDNSLYANITPVITDEQLKYSSNKRQTQYLSTDQEDRVTPHGYQDSDGWWVSASQEIAQSVQRLTEAEEARKEHDAIMMSEYKQAIDELKAAAIGLAEKPAGFNFTQNNYSPQSLSPSKIYRNTKTALATASAAASPTGRSVTDQK